MEVVEIIQKCIGRNLSVNVMENKVTLVESGLNSIEIIKIIVAIEEKYFVSLNELLDKINILTIDMLNQVITQHHDNRSKKNAYMEIECDKKGGAD